MGGPKGGAGVVRRIKWVRELGVGVEGRVEWKVHDTIYQVVEKY